VYIYKVKWMDFIVTHCEDPHMVHNAKHLLSIEKNRETDLS